MAKTESDKKKEGKRHKKQKVAKKIEHEESEPLSKLKISKKDRDEISYKLGEGDNQLLEKEKQGNKKKTKYKLQKVAKKYEGKESEMQWEWAFKRKRVGDNQSPDKKEKRNRKNAKKIEELQRESGSSRQEKDEINDEFGRDNRLLEKEKEGKKKKMKPKSKRELGSPLLQIKKSGVHLKKYKKPKEEKELETPKQGKDEISEKLEGDNKLPEIKKSDVPSKMKRPRTAVEDLDKEYERSKSGRYYKVFTDDEEMLILKGLIEYMEAKKNIDSTLNMKDFRTFINKSLSYEAERRQLYEKIRRWRNKYEKRKTKGVNLNYSTFHDIEIHELCGKLWGEGGSLTPMTMRKRRVKVSKKDKVNVEVNSNLEDFGTPKELDLVEEPKGAESEAEQKKLDLLKLENFLRVVVNKQQVTKTILEAYKRVKGVQGPIARK